VEGFGANSGDCLANHMNYLRPSGQTFKLSPSQSKGCFEIGPDEIQRSGG
jgi:hypothetical protein